MPVKTIFIWPTFVINIHIDQEMATNDFSASSNSESEVSEMEDYELEVEGSPNSSYMASDEEGTKEAYADDPLAKTQTPISSLLSLLTRSPANRFVYASSEKCSEHTDERSLGSQCARFNFTKSIHFFLRLCFSESGLP